MQSSPAKIILISLFFQIGIHFRNRLRFLIEGADMHDLYTCPVIDGKKFRPGAIQLFLLFCSLYRPFEILFCYKVRQTDNRIVYATAYSTPIAF